MPLADNVVYSCLFEASTGDVWLSFQAIDMQVFWWHVYRAQFTTVKKIVAECGAAEHVQREHGPDLTSRGHMGSSGSPFGTDPVPGGRCLGVVVRALLSGGVPRRC